MTCRSCKRFKECTDPHRSCKYDEDGDSWANWCDEFFPVRETICIELEGYEVTQNGRNHHVMIRDIESGRIVAHYSCNKPKTIASLRKMVIEYKAWLKAHRKIRVVDIDEEEIMREYEADGRQGKF